MGFPRSSTASSPRSTSRIVSISHVVAYVLQLEAICLKAMQPSPEARYATAAALAEDLERWLADEPVASYSEPLSSRFARRGRRHKSAMAGAATFLLSAVLGLSIGMLLLSQANAKIRRAESEAVQNAREVERQGGIAGENFETYGIELGHLHTDVGRLTSTPDAAVPLLD